MLETNSASAAPRLPGDLYWLPRVSRWAERIAALEAEADPAVAWTSLVALANTGLDFVRTIRLDRALRRLFPAAPKTGMAAQPVRLAVLASSTVAQVLPAIRVAALRRGIHLEAYEPDYGQYRQALSDAGSGLHRFKPNFVLISFDAYHLLRGAHAGLSAEQARALVAGAVGSLTETWRQVQSVLRCQVIQQAALPVFVPLLGENEHRLPGSPTRLVVRLNEALREAADANGVDILGVDARAAVDGLGHWHDQALWARAKQEVSPTAGPLYGDLVGRLIAARLGRSAKCLVLDLDNTLWGGVIGDDGLDGIVLGQGSARGEAFLAFQEYALQLSRRGIILAVCSKNDEANALAPFERHPEMVLRRHHIGSFVANWSDKAANIRQIAHALNIGLDAMVFVDDNPFERELVRGELPMVSVPELPEDPGSFARCLADAGYFEAVAVTDEDRERTAHYQASAARGVFEAKAADLPSYLRGLQMRMVWTRFDTTGRQRIVQLVNKTNQFNLTTRRISAGEVDALMADPARRGLQIRLLDRFGDNGIVAIVILRKMALQTAVIDTWLMSCRVLGRQVEEATLGLVIRHAREMGAETLLGDYIPTAKNGMVRDHYRKLGFTLEATQDDGTTRWVLDLHSHEPAGTFLDVVEGNST